MMDQLIHTSHPLFQVLRLPMIVDKWALGSGGSARKSDTLDKSPIGRLSPENFMEVFDHCLSLTDSDAKVPLGITLSHVSKAWRDVALDHSPLWTRIVCKKPILPPSVLKVNEFIQRSKKKPLDIVLYLHCGNPEENEEAERGYRHGVHPDAKSQDRQNVLLVLEALATQTYRWRRIYIAAPAYDYEVFPDLFLQWRQMVSSSAAPLLESASFCPGLSIDHDHYSEDQRQNLLEICSSIKYLPQILAGGTPNLKFIRCTSFAFPTLLPPLHNIVNLQIVYTDFRGYGSQNPPIFTFYHLCHILSLPNLETLLLSGDEFGACASPEDNLPTIPCPRLKHFYFDSTTYCFDNLVRVMDAYNLERLTLKSFQPRITGLLLDPPKPFKAVSTLELLSCRPVEDELIYLMDLVPNISTLAIHGDCFELGSGFLTDGEIDDEEDEEQEGEGEVEENYACASSEGEQTDSDPGQTQLSIGPIESIPLENANGRIHRRSGEFGPFDKLIAVDQAGFHPWRSLSRIQYHPLGPPNLRDMLKWLLHRKSRGALPLDTIQVTPCFMVDDFRRSHPEVEEIEQLVGSLESWDRCEEVAEGPVPWDSELAIEDVKFRPRDY
ncbi:unnamed protein product [Cyclocybe aegerita]|uniref:F-box domain-containing protein n=1 Tax=Cyclocybe aegerita TaxID=1973307 RepID=A0A8S0W561_CYCAE|nr:unnamed protein product [Cyclocybe aegerita]